MLYLVLLWLLCWHVILKILDHCLLLIKLLIIRAILKLLSVRTGIVIYYIIAFNTWTLKGRFSVIRQWRCSWLLITFQHPLSFITTRLILLVIKVLFFFLDIKPMICTRAVALNASIRITNIMVIY